MAISYNDIIASVPFLFHVGPEKAELTIHSALVAHHSRPLDVLMNGPMIEASERRATLKDIDKNTFARFSQYAYTGDYVGANPEIVLDSSTIGTAQPTVDDAAEPVADVTDGAEAPQPEDEPKIDFIEEPVAAVAEDPWESWGLPKKHRRKAACELAPKTATTSQLSKKSNLWNDFKAEVYLTTAPAFQPRKNQEPCEDYTEVFLSHAKLYVFAETYDISRLKKLSLDKLQSTLAEFTLYKERLEDVVNLLRYSYLNTVDRSGAGDRLRRLVSHYAACVVEDLTASDKFQSLLAKETEFARDLVALMIRRLD